MPLLSTPVMFPNNNKETVHDVMSHFQEQFSGAGF